MKLLLDTSVLIDHLRGDARATELLLTANRRSDELWSVVVCRTEVLRGMRARERAQTHRLLDSITWLEVGRELADRAGGLAREHGASHPGIDVVDFIVAAAADTLGARLMTRNVRHFPMLGDLQPAYT